MFSFANPQYLYLLLLLPIVVVIFWAARRARARNIARFGQPALVAGLMPDVSRYKPWIILALQLLLLSCVVIILARPRAGAKQTNTTVHGVEVMVCVDVSNSMNAAADDNMTDISRLQRSKMLLQKLIDKLQGNKVGLIVFAGQAYMQMPLTADAQGGAISMAASSFSKNPHTQKSIIVITDGENFEDDAMDAAKQARKAGIQVNVVGIGSTKGSPIPTAHGYMTDDQGKQVITRLNESEAQKIAAAGKGLYVNGASNDAVDDIHQALQKLSKSDLGSYVYTLADEQFPVFAWIALLLLLAVILVIDRKNPWLKKYNFFTKEQKHETQS